MYRDLQQGSPIEAEQIIGDLLARGARAGIATPLLASAYAHLSVYQQRITAVRAPDEIAANQRYRGGNHQK
jgi:2-dehydropantoate 2-reductase